MSERIIERIVGREIYLVTKQHMIFGNVFCAYANALECPFAVRATQAEIHMAIIDRQANRA